ncbi:MAG: nicotinate (nicotinamide) nucleotide adenylyltransferase [Spirochaetota bacterium]
MKTAIIGGSFNPPHYGHVHVIRLVEQYTDYSRIILVPLHTPSHKEVDSFVSADKRLDMLNVLIENQCPECLVDTCEIERGGISYTWDTVQSIKARYPDIDDKIGIIIGDDLLEGLLSWHEIDKLKQHAVFVVVCRNLSGEQMESYRHAFAGYGIELTMLRDKTVDISSSDIRKRVQHGQSITGLLPDAIIEYMERNGLYAD